MSDGLFRILRSLLLAFALGVLWGYALSGHASDTVSGFSLVLDRRGIQDSERAAVEAFLKEAEARVPAHLASVLGRKITVRFSSGLDSRNEILTPPCPTDEPSDLSEEASRAKLSSQVRGRVKKGFFERGATASTLELHAGFKHEISLGEAGSRRYACGHKNLYRLAMGTLLHEISHLYDYSDYRTSDQKAGSDLCFSRMLTDSGSDPNEKIRCDRMMHGNAVSSWDDFREAMGWADGPVVSPRNELHVRSPDPYEFKNIEESFAVNMEYFLMDPEFACRRPTVHEFLSSRFGSDPFPDRSCRVRTEAQFTRSVVSASDPGSAELDPSRIYQIHHLYASAGKDLISRWGHSMYRIIVCDPKRAAPGPECLNDILYHAVVSFRANPDDWNLDPWKGLNGGYPSQLYLYRFYPQIVNEYTIDEMRDLVSLPLKLTEDEKKRFVYRVLEQMHEYQGRYSFFTNNCATEALEFLRGILRQERLREIAILTPSGLYGELLRIGLIDDSVLEDPAQAAVGGNLFASKRPELEATYKKLRAGIPALKKISMEEYLQSSRAMQRRVYFETAITRATDPERSVALRFFVLESQILRAKRQTFVSEIASRVEQSTDPLVKRMAEAMTRSTSMLPGGAPPSGYGIPLEEDFSVEGPTGARDPSLLNDLFEWARRTVPDEWNELQATQANRDFFLLKSRQRPAGN